MNLRKSLVRVVGAAAVATLAAGAAPAAAAPVLVTAAGPLSDLQPATPNATDGAYGQLWAVAPGDGTSQYVLFVSGLDPAAAGKTFGAHVHVGPCVAGNGPAALGHYKHGDPAATATNRNEVWLDFTVRPGGFAVARASVPFEIESGTARSVVVHAERTQAGGQAGGRIACLPVAF